jgi:uncharacterized repeat protein (TIGR03803 family)
LKPGRTIMTNAVQHRGWISRRSLRGVSAALTLAVALALEVGATQSAQAQTFTVLHRFCSQSNCTDGATPWAGLVQDAAGNLYGTTAFGGAYDGGAGTVFKIDTSGNETVLYSFCSVSDCADGAGPTATLVLDAQGNLYGTTSVGGGTGCGGPGCGTVFKLDTSGNETVLYSFTGGTADGCFPQGGVVLDAAGNLYGTTNVCGSSNEGTVFKVDTSGNETVLHNFTGGVKDGGYPEYSSLLLDKKGDIYGVTPLGGPSDSGVLYKLSSSGAFTVLHTLEGPYGTPAMDKQGNLYGTTSAGGRHGNGTVWKVSPKRKLTVLHMFRQADGIEPYAGVVLDAEGNLYGTTWRGGPHSVDGTVYELNTKGVLTVLHSFAYASDGAEPYGNLILDAAGNLYGTAWVGGNYNDKCQGYRNEQGCGTVWKLTP